MTHSSDSTPHTAETPSGSLLDRIAARKIQEANVPPVLEENPSSGTPHNALKRILQSQGKTGYPARLKHKLTHAPSVGFGRSGSGGFSEDSLLHDMIAEKITAETGQRPNLTPEETLERLQKDRFIEKEVVYFGNERFKTTREGMSSGVYAALRNSEMVHYIKSNPATIVFDKNDFLAAMNETPKMFLSLYQYSRELKPAEVLNRLEKMHVLSPLQSETLDAEAAKKTGSSQRQFYYTESQALYDTLQELHIPTGMVKGQGFKLLKAEMENALQKNPKAFDHFVQDPVTLEPQDVVKGLVKRGLIVKLTYAKNTKSELSVQTDEAVRILENNGVHVRHQSKDEIDGRKRGGRYIETDSLDKALNASPEMRAKLLKDITVVNAEKPLSR